MLEEWVDSGATPDITYTIGDDVISQYNSTDGTECLLYDGHGSTRQLVDSSEDITDAYSYDAYGVMLGGNPETPQNPGSPATNLLYAGEQFDTGLQMYYNRARYYDQNTGRFNRMDPFAGNNQDPQSLHKYNYVNNNPINGVDPSGRLFSTPYHGRRVQQEIFHHFKIVSLNDRLTDRRINTILGVNVPWWGWDRPDLVDRTTTEVWEIKPIGSYIIGAGQLGWYLLLLNTNDPLGRTWKPGVTYMPQRMVTIDAFSFAIVNPPVGGVITYEVVELRPLIALVTVAALAQLRAHLAMIQLRAAFARVLI